MKRETRLAQLKKGTTEGRLPCCILLSIKRALFAHVLKPDSGTGKKKKQFGIYLRGKGHGSKDFISETGNIFKEKDVVASVVDDL